MIKNWYRYYTDVPCASNTPKPRLLSAWLRFLFEKRTNPHQYRKSSINSFLGDHVRFLFEKQTESYKWYGEGSIAEEKRATVPRSQPTSKLCLEVGWLERSL